MIKERADFVSDFWELSDYFFVAPTTYNEKAVKKQWKEGAPEVMSQLVTFLKNIEDFSSQNLENLIKQWIAEQELSFGKVMPPLRLVIVGDMKGPHLFDIMGILGKEESIERMERAITSIG